MTNPCVLISEPSTYMTDPEVIKKYVSKENADLLAGVTMTGPDSPYQNVKLLVGDPDYVFSEPIADMLCTVGVLSREPVLDKNKRPVKIKLPDDKEEAVYHYAWGEKAFTDCTQEQLLAVGWDLRTHPGFVRVLRVDAEKPQQPVPVVEHSTDDGHSDTSDDLSSEAA